MTDNSDTTIQTGDVSIVINPGSGSVAGSTLPQALANLTQFIADLNIDTTRAYRGGIKWVRLPENDDRGHFGFLLYWGTRCTTIKMPGIPLGQLRYMKEPGQDIWDFPRLYVNGSSWVWVYALGAARSLLDGTEEG